MNKFLVSVSLATLTLVLPVFAAQASNHAACQVKLLKVASEALDKEFPKFNKGVWQINEVDFNYGVEGLPQVIFISRPASYADQVCLIKVGVSAEPETDSGCPDYKFARAYSTCD